MRSSASARFRVSGPAGQREVAAAEYYQLPDRNLFWETVLAPNELLTHLVLPPPGAARPRGQQVGQRFGEGPARAGGVPAVEPADQEVKANRAAEVGQIGRTTAVAAMDGLAEGAAVRAGCAGLRPLGGNLDGCRAGARHLLDTAARNQKQLIH